MKRPMVVRGIGHSPVAIKRYLGFTLLSHSSVSLIINEILAVIAAKEGFELAGEIPPLQKGDA